MIFINLFFASAGEIEKLNSKRHVESWIKKANKILELSGSTESLHAIEANIPALFALADQSLKDEEEFRSPSLAERNLEVFLRNLNKIYTFVSRSNFSAATRRQVAEFLLSRLQSLGDRIQSTHNLFENILDLLALNPENDDLRTHVLELITRRIFSFFERYHAEGSNQAALDEPTILRNINIFKDIIELIKILALKSRTQYMGEILQRFLASFDLLTQNFSILPEELDPLFENLQTKNLAQTLSTINTNSEIFDEIMPDILQILINRILEIQTLLDRPSVELPVRRELEIYSLEEYGPRSPAENIPRDRRAVFMRTLVRIFSKLPGEVQGRIILKTPQRFFEILKSPENLMLFGSRNTIPFLMAGDSPSLEVTDMPHTPTLNEEWHRFQERYIKFRENQYLVALEMFPISGQNTLKFRLAQKLGITERTLDNSLEACQRGEEPELRCEQLRRAAAELQAVPAPAPEPAPIPLPAPAAPAPALIPPVLAETQLPRLPLLPPAPMLEAAPGAPGGLPPGGGTTFEQDESSAERRLFTAYIRSKRLSGDPKNFPSFDEWRGSQRK